MCVSVSAVFCTSIVNFFNLISPILCFDTLRSHSIWSRFSFVSLCIHTYTQAHGAFTLLLAFEMLNVCVYVYVCEQWDKRYSRSFCLCVSAVLVYTCLYCTKHWFCTICCLCAYIGCEKKTDCVYSACICMRIWMSIRITTDRKRGRQRDALRWSSVFIGPNLNGWFFNNN